ncbi:MAG: N-acetyltransferase family protein [Nanobdellota archaeon]
MEIVEASIEEVVQANARIPEFGPYDAAYFEDRCADALALVAYVDGQPAGYIVSYDRFQDGSLYCWMAGVDPDFRRQGVLSGLMDYQYAWAREQGYTKIRIKTRNTRRKMLSFLVSSGYLFTAVEGYDRVEENRILLEKDL